MIESMTMKEINDLNWHKAVNENRKAKAAEISEMNRKRRIARRAIEDRQDAKAMASELGLPFDECS